MKSIITSQKIVFFIDDEDYDRVSKHTWHIVDCKYNYYVRRTIRVGKSFKHQYLHRLIMGEPEGLQVNHKNKDTLDNRRQNLEIVTQQQNLKHMREFERCVE